MPGIIDQIAQLAADSDLAKFKWTDDNGDKDRAPLAYVKGMAVVYARVYGRLKAGDAAAAEMAKKKTGDADKDALTWYEEKFADAGMSNDADGVDTLRHLFVLLVGLGIRESSGRHCVGRYRKQDFKNSDDAEAGLFQASYNVTRSCPAILTNLFNLYSANPDGFLDIFQVGIHCSADDWQNWGKENEPGYKWQQLTKTCPAFAAEFAAVGLRHDRQNWGPIIRRQAEIVPSCDALFKAVEQLVDKAEDASALVA